jgi:hypothetical protein
MLPDENVLHPSISSKARLDFGGSVDRVIDFRQHAEECRQLARRARTAADRDMLLDMAATWESLAASRQRLIERKPAS